MKNAAITTTLLSSLLVACGDGVIVGDSGLQSDGVTPVVSTLNTPFTTLTDTAANNNPANTTPANAPQVNDTPTNNTPANIPPANNTPVNNNAGNVNFYGLVSMSENVLTNQVTGYSAFMEFPNGMPLSEITAQLTPTQDTCTVVDSSQPVVDEGIESTFVSAGEVLTVTSANGTYIQLTREVFDNFTMYNPEPGFVDGRLPAGLNVDIPGDVFPAFNNIAAAPVQTLNLTSPSAVDPITATTAFSWNTNNTAGSVISISATSFLNSVAVSVACTTMDDGEFTFPASIQSQMGDQFSSIAASISRDAMTVDQYGNAALVVTTSSKAR